MLPKRLRYQMQIKVFFARRGVKFDRGAKISARQVNNLADDLTIESHMSVEAKEKLGTMDFKCVEANPRLIVHRRSQLFVCLFSILLEQHIKLSFSH